ncbi:hypothetical protein [Myxosarcina sp. GI1]|uniref:hypothetical protein n=1 Tax=Myxosarcina sp. GI1 TaxID=1541065 RepID=UPI00209D1DA0|nr:hypothetical protein [Myxosarcina sp. GI1]
MTTSPALAIDMCRNIKGQKLCIVRIKRSAKNYWEYRTKVEIDGKRRVKEIYNCRDYAPRTAKGDRTVTRKGKVAIPFKPNSLGELVCDLFS